MEALLRDHYGIEGHTPEPLPGGRTGHLWRCGPWVLKLYDTRRLPRHRAEQALRIQSALAAEGLPVPDPRRTKSGGLWAEAAGGLVAVMPYISGTSRTRGRLRQHEAAALGVLIARLHLAFRHLSFLNVSPPAPPDPKVMVDQWAEWRREALAQSRRTPFDTAVIRMAEYVESAAASLPQVDWTQQPWQVCHRDLHLGNLVFGRSGRVAAVLDFDSAAPWWTAAELMMAWNLSFSAEPGALALTPEGAAFFTAYRRTAPLPESVVRAMPSAYRLVLMNTAWPASLRYRRGMPVQPEWAELLDLRLAAIRWLQRHESEMGEWLLG